MKPRLILTAALAALVFGCAVHQNRPAQPGPKLTKHAFTTDKNVTYTPSGWPQALQADVYVPKGQGPFPAVLVVHGGGWQAGNRGQMAPVARGLAGIGLVAMNISYRLAPKYQFPAQLYDVQQAVRWLRQHQAEYHVDPRHVGAYGYSAGAHLVALLGTIFPGDPLDSPYGGAETRLQAVAGGGTPTDLRTLNLPQFLPDFLGGTQAQIPKRYALASPILHVRSTTPPFFLFNGEADKLVPISQAKAFVKNLQRFGVHAELYRMPLRNHVTAAISPDAAQAAAKFLYRSLQ